MTRAAAARVPSAIEAPAAKTAPAEKTRSRKPLVNRNNAPSTSQKGSKLKAAVAQIADDGDREPIKVRPWF